MHRRVIAVLFICLAAPTAAAAAKQPSTAEAAHQSERYLKHEYADDLNGSDVYAECKKPKARRGVLSYECSYTSDADGFEGMVWAEYTSKKKVGHRWHFKG